jgi:hypothetical protein
MRHRRAAFLASPKLDQFPSRQPLSAEELALARYVQSFPREATLIAHAQEEFELEIQKEMNNAGSQTQASVQEERWENMRRTIALLVAVVSIGLLCDLGSARGQDESEKTASAQTAKVQPVQPYRLDFAFNELTDGKIVNTRRYSMNLTAGESNEIKIGARVPVVTGSSPGVNATSQWQYLDVGTNIWAQLREHGDEIVLAVRSEVSSLDMNSDTDHAGIQNPVIRQIKISGSTLLVVGKPTLVGSMDDPNSKRQFQLEVTVTKLR